MKKTIVMMIVLVFLFSITACSNSGGKGETNKPIDEGNTQEEATEEKTEKTKTDDHSPKTIVFSTFWKDEFFEQAKKEYEAKHPNITIEYTYVNSGGISPAGGEDIKEFIKTTNAAMLSGNGPDLMEMDLLPIGKYVNKKLLADMSKMMDNDPTFNREHYFTNVLDGTKLNGGLYNVPLDFFIKGFVGNETLIEKSGVNVNGLIWDWNQFLNVATDLKAHGDPNYTYALNTKPEELLNDMLMNQYAVYVDEANGIAKFDSDSFIQLVKQVKGLFDKGVVTTKTKNTIFKQKTIASHSDYLLSLKESEYLAKGYEFKSKLYASPKGNGQKGGSYYRSVRQIGINEKSTMKDEAWDFVKFMLSDEMEGSASRGAFPLNKEVYKKLVAELLKDGKVEDHEYSPLAGKVFTITKQDIAEVNIFLEEAKYPVAYEVDKTQEIIMEESKAYFSGQKSAEAIAKLIQNRVSIYLNE